MTNVWDQLRMGWAKHIFLKQTTVELKIFESHKYFQSKYYQNAVLELFETTEASGQMSLATLVVLECLNPNFTGNQSVKCRPFQHKAPLHH